MNKTLVLWLSLLALGCADTATGKRAESGGTVVVVTGLDPGTLFQPTVTRIQGKQIAEQIYDYLADVGPGLDARDEKSFRPGLADGWRWSSDSLMLAFHIHPNARWHDGKPVTARDVQFTFALNKDPELASRLRSSLTNIDSVTVMDSLTAAFWFHGRSPTQFLDAAAQMLILPAHQLERVPLRQLRETPPPPIGTGRFRLRRWDKGASVEIVADTSNFRGRARLDRVIWSVIPDFTTSVTRLARGDADLMDGLRPENLRDVARNLALRTITLPGMDYAFLRFNLRDPAELSRPHPLFGDRSLRRAITMAVNRDALVRSVLDTFAFVPVGPVVRAYPTTDASLAQIPFDSARASGLLDSLGWKRNTAGMRVRNGKDLAFDLLVPSVSITRNRMAVLLQEQLRRAGIRVNLENIETSVQTSREASGAFDSALGAWTMASSPDGTKDAWGSSGLGRNGVNYGAYSNPKFDALLDSALTGDETKSRGRFTRAYSIINEDAPAIWLYEPQKIIGIHRRIRTGKMRPDAWWFDLANWYIPARERVLRDRIPLR